ncbi:hypothetical protein [Lentibacillus sediminis]|uniref:hypothetical protein n=1 Tax=Lentibacillus sediminis TaxID=1940529 RepID=UPI000C1C1ED2|nr:hypothetical protein [Lentibacillus sediminis]
MNEKEEVIQLIRNLPENATMEDILHELYVHIKFQHGTQEMNNGKQPSQNQKPARTKSGRWLH